MINDLEIEEAVTANAAEPDQSKFSAEQKQLITARLIKLLQGKAVVQSQDDYRAVMAWFYTVADRAGIENFVLLFGSQDQLKGCNAWHGKKGNILEMIKYVNATVLPEVAPHVKIKMHIKRI